MLDGFSFVAAKPPQAGISTPQTPNRPTAAPVDSPSVNGILTDQLAPNNVYIALNVVGSILLCLGIALGVTVVVFFVKARNR